MSRFLSLAFSLILAVTIPSVANAAARVALVVGVSKYEHAGVLTNTINDASDMTAALKRLGFDVETVLDPSRAALEAAVRRYGDRSTGAEVSLFHYSGHALEAGGRNWILPATANVNSERDLRFEAIDLDTILEQTDGAAKVSIAFLDACRDNPFARQLSRGRRDVVARGLGRVDVSATGTLVAFAAAPGQVALDGDKKNSPFTAAILSHIEAPGLEIKSMFARVTRDVVEATKGKQRPWQNSSLEGEFYFVPQLAAKPAGPAPANLEVVFWDSIKGSRNPADFDAYLTKFPKGVFTQLAQNRLTMLRNEVTSRPQAADPSPDAPPAPRQANTPPVQPAPAQPEPPALAMRDVLLARMAGYSIAESERESQVKTYETDAGHKAMAVSLESRRTYRTVRWATAGEAEIGALEGCQLVFGNPCVLMVVDDQIQRGSPLILRDMPRVRYSGSFDVKQIPRARPALFGRGNITSYGSAAAPKAAAFHHGPGMLFIAVAAGSQADAEQQALNDCNNNQDVKTVGGPCFLYAVGNQVVLPQRSTKPLSQRSIDQARSPEVSSGAPTTATPATSLQDRVSARLVALSVAPDEAARIARSYATESGHKTIAVSVNAHHTWRSGAWPSAEAAETGTLESCQIFFAEPCALAATNDKVEEPEGPPKTRDMPRTHYSGRFEPERIPRARTEMLRRPDVMGYRTTVGPKAAAYHPWGRLFIATGAATQFEAEEKVLAECNADPTRKGANGPCFLYAVGDQVILQQRLLKPRPLPRTVSEGFAYLSVPRDSYPYLNDKGHKAIAVALESGQTFRWAGHASAARAEELTLEGCQLEKATPCVLLASDDTLQAPDPWKAARRDMPRLHYDGKYNPENVPLFSAEKSELQSYNSMRAPKAMVVRPNGARVRIATGSTPEDAQAKALAACNEALGSMPCFVYAVNDRVVLNQRSTEPVK